MAACMACLLKQWSAWLRLTVCSLTAPQKKSILGCLCPGAMQEPALPASYKLQELSLAWLRKVACSVSNEGTVFPVPSHQTGKVSLLVQAAVRGERRARNLRAPPSPAAVEQLPADTLPQVGAHPRLLVFGQSADGLTQLTIGCSICGLLLMQRP